MTADTSRTGSPASAPTQHEACTICGEPRWRHNDIEQFCPIYPTYRAPKFAALIAAPVPSGPRAVLTPEVIETFRSAAARVVRVNGPAQLVPADQLVRLCESHEALRAQLLAAQQERDTRDEDSARLDWLDQDGPPKIREIIDLMRSRAARREPTPGATNG
jgi:hypothetical protein